MDVSLQRLNLYSLAVTLHISRFSIKKIYLVLTLFLCVVCLSLNKLQRLPYEALTDGFCITEVEGVYCAVRTNSLSKTDTFHLANNAATTTLQGKTRGC
jgi:membrane protein required for beta-lactamase induction